MFFFLGCFSSKDQHFTNNPTIRWEFAKSLGPVEDQTKEQRHTVADHRRVKDPMDRKGQAEPKTQMGARDAVMGEEK